VITTAATYFKPAKATSHGAQTSPAITLAVALLGFFVVTFDAVVVNVALPTIRHDLGGGITGLQWVADGYTLSFAALLLTAGALSDRVGARRAFGDGLAVFIVASALCGLSLSLPMLVAARFLQGAAAAVMMPSSMALIREAYPSGPQRARALATWAMGGAVASSSAPILGGLLTLLSWRGIFFVNVPVGLAALLMLSRTSASPQRPAPIDWLGQLTAVLAMGGLTFGAIEVGAWGLGSPLVIASFVVAVLGALAFVITQGRVRHPMVPLTLLRIPTVRTSSVIGFAFMVGYYGLPFIISLYFQQVRGLSPLATGALFLPMFVTGFILTPFSARLAERLGAQLVISVGLLSMTIGLAVMGMVVSASTPIALLSGLMVLIGLGGPLAMPMTTALLLEHVPPAQAGTASGVFNTSRQIGGALAVAVFGILLAHRATFIHGERLALLIAAAVVLSAAAASLSLEGLTAGAHKRSLTKAAINV
jgi:MFS transporter, DHA2 family, methylenomycin A resistance protein